MSLKLEPKAGWSDTSGDAASPARLSGSGGSKARANRLPHSRAAGFTWSSHNMNGDPTGVIFSILAYSFCSSTMLVVNKVAVGHLRVPTAVRCRAGQSLACAAVHRCADTRLCYAVARSCASHRRSCSCCTALA